MNIPNILLLLGLIWIAGYAMFRCVGWHGHYVSATKKFFIKPFLRLLSRTWVKHKKTILTLLVGIAIGFAIARNLAPSP